MKSRGGVFNWRATVAFVLFSAGVPSISYALFSLLFAPGQFWDNFAVHWWLLGLPYALVSPWTITRSGGPAGLFLSTLFFGSIAAGIATIAVHAALDPTTFAYAPLIAGMYILPQLPGVLLCSLVAAKIVGLTPLRQELREFLRGKQ